ncbi:MAG: FliH/SctL family protein [Myxococcota bacterium]
MGETLDAAMSKISAEEADARKEAQALIDEAKSEGKQKGALQAAQLKEKLTKLKTIYASEMEPDLVRNALSVAQTLVSSELKSSPDALLRFVQEALKTVSEAEIIRIRANPAHTQILKNNKEQLINLLQRAKDIDIREDKQVSEGILLQTESGVIDAQLKTQVEEISRVLGI